MKTLFLILSFLVSYVTMGQCIPEPTPPYNLVLNGGFEQYSQLPDAISTPSNDQISRACGWSRGTTRTPDYFHADADNEDVSIPNNFFGFEGVNSLYGGRAYSGIAHRLDNKEVLRTQLSTPLEENTDYLLQFDVSSSDLDEAISYLRFQAYLDDEIVGTDIIGDLEIDSEGIFLEDNAYSTNTMGWNTITFTFTTGNTAGQEFLYIGALNDIDILNPGPSNLGYSYVDNVILYPTCNNHLPPAPGAITLFPEEYDCSSFPITIMGAYEHPENLDGTFTTLENITLNIFQDGVQIPTSITVTSTSTMGIGEFSAVIEETDLPIPIVGEYTFEVIADFIFDVSCDDNDGTAIGSISTQSGEGGPVIDADLFCCNDTAGFVVVATCGFPGCDPCDSIDGNTTYILVDGAGNQITNSTFPGAQFTWLNTNTGETSSADSFTAPIDDTVTVTLSHFNGCSIGPIESDLDCNTGSTCGTCNNEEDGFPVISNSYDLGSFTRLFGKTVTSDCSGNIYSLGNWNGITRLNKIDVSGNLLWSQIVNIGAILSSSNVVMEVDDNESIYVKNNDQLFKYNSNGIIDWEILINDNLFANRSNFTLNKDTGDLYLPVSSNFALVASTGTTTTFNFPNNQQSIARIDANANITDLGAFISSRVLNLHYNEGLKVWSRNLSGIEYRQYNTSDIIESADFDWVGNNLIALYDGFTPLFYNHISDEVLVYTGSQLASNNSNIRILSVNNVGTITNSALLPEALYIGQHLSAYQAPFAFNTNNGELAVYADNSSFIGGTLVSTISSNFELDTKTLVQSSFGPNPFYSRSYHAITYGGDCLYFYGQYRSNTTVTLEGGTILPSTGGTNNARSVIVRLQNDLTIASPFTKRAAVQNQLKAYPNPFKNNFVIEDNLHREIAFVEVFNLYGNLIHTQTYSEKQTITIDRGETGMYFAKVHFKDGTIETVRLLKE